MTDRLNPDLELVGRYVSGAASPPERLAVEEWVGEAPARQDLVRQLAAIWERTGTLDHVAAADADLDVDARWQALRREMAATRVVAFPSSAAWRSRIGAYAAAASIVIALGAGAWWLKQAPGVVRQTPAAVAMRDYATPRGQRAEFRLPDGSRVTLGVESRLRVPADYGIRDRRVYLVGEAYFEVEHDAAHRFFVHSPLAVTEDLGTRFTVRAYPSDTAARVVVAEGKVALSAEPASGVRHDTAAVLTAGELGWASASGEIVTRRGTDVDRYLAWTKGILEFRGTPLGEALPELGRWFDLDIRLGDSALASRRLTASFRDQLDQRMFDDLALTLDLRIERRGRSVTLYQR